MYLYVDILITTSMPIFELHSVCGGDRDGSEVVVRRELAEKLCLCWISKPFRT